LAVYPQPSPPHRFSYIRFLRRENKTLGRDIDIGGTEIPLGKTIKILLDYDIFRGSYSYSVFQDDRMDLAFSAGLSVLPIRFNFETTGLVEESAAESITAPLPVIGFRADYAITPKLLLKNRVNLFWLEISDFKDTIVDILTIAEYRAFKHSGYHIIWLNILKPRIFHNNFNPNISHAFFKD